MNRRALLRTAAAASLAGIAGCSGVVGRSASSGNTYLAKPRSQRAKSEALVYPAWGQAFPTSTVPAVFHEGSVTVPTDFSGKNFFLTWFYSYCPSVCPVEVGDLRAIQAKALKSGYDTRFVAGVFDPRQDTKQRLETFAREKYVDLQAGDWYFLRPSTPSSAKRIVTGTYGVNYQPSQVKDGIQFYDHGAYVFLVNDAGYVERVYHNSLESKVQWQPMWADLQTLRKREGKQV